MKKYLNKSRVSKVLIVFAVLLVILVLMNNVILPWYVSSTETKVPNLVGLTQEQAIRKILDLGLEPVKADDVPSDVYPIGTVVNQKPGGDKIVKEGRRVYIFISSGEELIKVPHLISETLNSGKILLEKAGLILGEVKEVASDRAKGLIIDQQIAEGTPVKKGTRIDVFISAGQVDTSAVDVPELIGKSLSEGEQILSSNSLKLGKISYQSSSSLLPNTIIDQYPSKGQKINVGDAIDVIVTKNIESEGK